jgi:hypothetical protein
MKTRKPEWLILPYAARLETSLNVDDSLARAIRERAFARDRRIGWQMLIMIEDGLKATHIPEEIAWAYSKLNQTMQLPVKYMSPEMLEAIRRRAIADRRTMQGEVVHLLKASIIAEQLACVPEERVTSDKKQFTKWRRMRGPHSQRRRRTPEEGAS